MIVIKKKEKKKNNNNMTRGPLQGEGERHTRGPGSLLGRDGLACFKLDWKRIDEELDETTKHCLACQEQARHPSKTYATWSWPTGPWQWLHIEFAGPFLGQMFLIVVDAYSKYLDVIPMSTATSSGTIKALRRLFATFWLPLQIMGLNLPVSSLKIS